ncbi:MAG: thioredoxin family protein [Bacillota bacterium]
MKVEVLGTGCPKCKKTEAVIRGVLAKLQLEAEVVDVTDINQIMARGVMMTPAVFVDGVKVMEGKVPSEAEAAAFLRK